MGDIPLGCWINRYLQLIEAGIPGVDPLPLPYAAAPNQLPHHFSRLSPELTSSLRPFSALFVATSTPKLARF